MEEGLIAAVGWRFGHHGMVWHDMAKVVRGMTHAGRAVAENASVVRY